MNSQSKFKNDALYRLNKCDEPEVEIVFFHGLGRDKSDEMYQTTWTTESGKECWPESWLAEEEDFPKARLFSVKYDSSATEGNDHGRFTMSSLVENLAWNLIEDGEIGQIGVPVVLVGHDLGGLVMNRLCLYLVEKGNYEEHASTWTSKLLKYINFLTCLAGVFYFATPHLGLRIVSNGYEAEGGLLRNLEIHNADVAIWNNNFNKLRQKRRWGVRGVGSANDDPKDSLHAKEASMRGNLDDFIMVPESIGSITRLKSRTSTTFQFFVSAVKEFVNSFTAREVDSSDCKFQDFLQDKVDLESVVEELVVELDRQQEKNAGTSAVVIHGMGGIGKSTLCTALFLRLAANKRRFRGNCKCFLDRERAKNSSSPVMQLQLDLLKEFQYGSAGKMSSQMGIHSHLLTCYKQKKKLKMPLLICIDSMENYDELKHLFPRNIGEGSEGQSCYCCKSGRQNTDFSAQLRFGARFLV